MENTPWYPPFHEMLAELKNIKKILSNLSTNAVAVSAPTLNAIPKKQELNKQEAANLLGISISTLDNLRRKEILKSYRYGKSSIRFKRSELLAYKAAQMKEI